MNLKDRVRTASKERKAQAKADKAKAEKAKAEAEKARAGTKTGKHDNTVVSMEGDRDSDEETMPPPIKKPSLRQRITEAYEKRVEETKAQRGTATTITPSAQLTVEKCTEQS